MKKKKCIRSLREEVNSTCPEDGNWISIFYYESERMRTLSARRNSLPVGFLHAVIVQVALGLPGTFGVRCCFVVQVLCVLIIIFL